MNKIIAVLPGDGIGPEVIQEALKVIKAIAAKFDHTFNLTEYPVGAAAMDRGLDPLPAETLTGCMAADAVLFGAVGDPKYDLNPAVATRPEHGLLDLRRKMDLHTNVRPVKSYRRLYSLSPLKEDFVQNVDLVLFRELTGGLYFGNKEKDEMGKWAIDECFYHKDEIERVSRLAFDEARTRRKKVTLVDKANVLETGRLWRLTAQEVQQKDYPDVELELMLIDQAAMQLILNARQFDVILTENMFGDILSDEASIIVGSIGLLPSGSYGEGDKAIFEPVHGSYPQAAGRNIANPLASILSVSMMLEHFQANAESDLVNSAVEFAIQEGLGTMDLVPRQMMTCSAMGDFITALISAPKSQWGSMRKNLIDSGT